MQGADGALYGSAAGGVVTLNTTGGFVYRFDPATGDFRHLHDFVLSDGRDPSGPLFQGTDGFFYGTTIRGGQTSSPGVYSGKGVVYKVDATGAFTLLHAFENDTGWKNELWNPKGGVIQASDGLLYGTTEGGGEGAGTVFRLDTSGGNFAILHRFDLFSSDGLEPQAGLIQARDGFFYGTAPYGGQPVTDPERKGVIYQMDFAGNVAVVHTFTGPDGGRPYAPVVQAADGRLYGTTAIGGAHDRGTVFAVDPPVGPPPPPPPSPSPSPDPTPPSEPPPPSAPPVISNLTLSPSTVQGGWGSTGEVTLSGAAPAGGAVVSLSASGGWAWTPSSVTVPEGTSFVTFQITTKLVKRTKVARITAFYNGSSAAAELMITP